MIPDIFAASVKRFGNLRNVHAALQQIVPEAKYLVIYRLSGMGIPSPDASKNTYVKPPYELISNLAEIGFFWNESQNRPYLAREIMGIYREEFEDTEKMYHRLRLEIAALPLQLRKQLLEESGRKQLVQEDYIYIRGRDRLRLPIVINSSIKKMGFASFSDALAFIECPPNRQQEVENFVKGISQSADDVGVSPEMLEYLCRLTCRIFAWEDGENSEVPILKVGTSYEGFPQEFIEGLRIPVSFASKSTLLV
jgi:hypothetical protein